MLNRKGDFFAINYQCCSDKKKRKEKEKYTTLWELTTSYHLSYSNNYFKETRKLAKCHIESQGRNIGAEPRRVDAGLAEIKERFPGRGV